MAVSFEAARYTILHDETPMDRPRHEHQISADSFALPNRDSALVDTDPWGLEEARNREALDKSTNESVDVDPDVSLGEIIGSQVAVNVLEAVAIVQKICWMTNDPPAVLFDLETVAIRASGDVATVGRPSATHDPSLAVQSVGTVLRALISRTSAPPQLQEIVAAAMTDGERFRSFAELANALRLYQSPNATELIRGVYLRWRNGVTTPADVSPSDTSKRLAVLARVWARVQSRLPRDRRVAAGLALCVVGGALLIVLSRYDFARSMKSASGTTSNTAVQTLASAVSSALNWIGLGPASPVASEDVASVSKKKVSNARPKKAGTTGPINSLRALQLTPLVNTATLRANAPAPVGGDADADATRETSGEDGLALPQDDSVETSIIYSPNDADVSPPVAIRSPGPATGRGNEDKNAGLIQILVNETGLVESATMLRAPATMGEALRSTMALSVVKTWTFEPARKNGQPVKYRTTVPFVETGVPAGTTDETRPKPR